MIITVTCNPSIDYFMNIDNPKLHALNRSHGEEVQAGGKGVNVSMMLDTLEENTGMLGFIAGNTGTLFLDLLQDMTDVPADFVMAKQGFTRINVKVRPGVETELNGQGPTVTEKEVEALIAKIKAYGDSSVIVLSGSLAHGLEQDFYARLLKEFPSRRFVVDTSGDALLKTLAYHPYLIKPNGKELEGVIGRPVKTKADAASGARTLIEKGARYVLVSLGGHGAVLVDPQGKAWQANAPKGRVVNTIGSGDSMVAGFLAAMEETHDPEEALRLGVAAGSASAFCQLLATEEEVMAVRQKVRVTPLD